MSDEQRGELQVMARSSSPHRKVVQARALLLAADGVANEEIARRCETPADAVSRWHGRFAESSVAGVGAIAAGRRRKPLVSAAAVDAIVADTLHEGPADGSTHWTTRPMAARHGSARTWSPASGRRGTSSPGRWPRPSFSDVPPWVCGEALSAVATQPVWPSARLLIEPSKLSQFTALQPGMVRTRRGLGGTLGRVRLVSVHGGGVRAGYAGCSACCCVDYWV